MNKVIWYLHHYAGSPSLGMSYRPYYFAKEFATLGYKPYVLAASFHHMLFKAVTVNNAITVREEDGVPYVWIKTNEYQGNALGRLWNMLSYSFKCVFYRKRITKLTAKPDVIIVSSPHIFHILAGKWLSRRYKAKLIFEVRDIWPLSLIEFSNISPKHPLIRVMSYLERFAYRCADIVVSLLPQAFEHMQGKGLVEDKFHYVPNGVPLTELDNNQALPQHYERTLQTWRKQNKFILAYTGAHGVANALDQIVEAANILQKNKMNDIQIILLGSGMMKQSLIKLAEKYQLMNIVFWDPIPHQLIPIFLSHVDAAFIGTKAANLFRFGVSHNKLFEYMLAKLPIINAVPAGNDVVEETQSGISVPAEQPEELAEAMIRISKLPSTDRKAMGQRGYDFVVVHHSYPKLAKKYVELFD